MEIQDILAFLKESAKAWDPEKQCRQKAENSPVEGPIGEISAMETAHASERKVVIVNPKIFKRAAFLERHKIRGAV
jgi:hypothetical protein